MSRFNPLASDSPLIVYIDYKSPYAFVAKDPTYAIEDQHGIEIDWRPLTLDIPSYLGSAKLNSSGKLVENNRSQQQWSGATTQGLPGYVSGVGRSQFDQLQTELRQAGVFSVPAYLIEDEIYYGRQHLPMISWMLSGRQGEPPI